MSVPIASPGLTQELTAVLDGAVTQSTTEEITAAVKEGLCRLIAAGSLELPAAYRRPRPDSYARRLLLRSREHGYTAIAMVWGPGQGTMLHDHCGIWCVEGVLEGQIEVVQYDLVEEDEERYRFERQGSVMAGRGAAGTLIPPFEYHTIANAVPDASTITLHIYGGEMDHCGVFEPQADGWYRRLEKRLTYSD